MDGIKKYKWAVLVLFLPLWGYAQSTQISLQEEYYHNLSRYEIKAGRIAPEWFTTLKPVKRDMAVAFIDSLQKKDQVFTSQADRFNYDYFRNDSWEWGRPQTSQSTKPVLKKLFQKKSDLFYVDNSDFDLHVNPVLYVGVGADSRGDNKVGLINTRGIEVRGMVDRKIGFYTSITDNQQALPSYVNEKTEIDGVIPHEGFWKKFNTRGVDFFQARAYIDFNITQHINTQFGHDRTFVGNGYRSLIFSDYAPPSLFLRTNLKIWKINYLYQINRFIANDPGSLSKSGSTQRQRYPDRFMAFHHVSINVGKKLNLGFFESIVFTPQDTLNRNAFELSYLNPVIFMRAAEQQNGSSDNALLGFDFKWNALKCVSLYGQLVLDEFVFSELRSSKGWWANKYAGQIGLKYIDVGGISNLDIQLEYNFARPYTYSHNTSSNYSHFSQPLAHPFGANFTEMVAIIRYQPIGKLSFTGRTFFAHIGRDDKNQNWGSDVLKDYVIRQADYGNFVNQGNKNEILYIDITASYMLKHNFFIDLKQIIRDSQCELPQYNNNTSFTLLGIRWNIPARTYEF